MKKQNLCKYYLLAGLIIWGCNKPAPTELIQDSQTTNDAAQIEVITKNINDQSYSNGYDSTGVADSLMGHVNTIYVSGIKITSKIGTLNTSLAEAIFFDKSKPVNVGGYLIGYRTLTPGTILFNSHRARLVPLKVRIRNSAIDTSLGLKYFLYSGKRILLDPFRYEYNSNIDFQFIPIIGSSISFKIPTPPEITGNIKIEGARNNNLKVILDWDLPSPNRQIEIIIGAVDRTSGEIFPMYRVITRDDGRFQIPVNLIKQIPTERFNKVVVTFIRKYEKYENNAGNKNDLYILSQSVHTIIIDSP
jgi:hypothetical protein